MNMYLTRPSRSMFNSSLERTFDDFFNSFFNESHPLSQLGKASYPKLNIIDNDNEMVVEAAVPGLSRDDIDVEIKDNIITIKSDGVKKIDNYTSDSYVRREIKFSSFSRSLEVNDTNLDLEQIDGSFENGVLVLKIPKKAIEPPKSKKIEIK